MGKEEFKRTVYELANGFLELDLCTIPEKELITDEFSEGNKCSQLYSEVYKANMRICQRLGIKEDRDVEIIINNLLEIGEYLGMKMYDYGAQFSRK